MLKIITLTILFVSFTNIDLDAQFKVKENSEKKKPDWMLMPGSGYIKSTGTGNTIDEAKKFAIDSALSYINKKVTEYMLNENTYFKGIGIDKNTALTIFMNSEYYAGIKAGNNDGIYWELLANKKTKEESYHYYLKYNIDTEKVSGIVDKLANASILIKLDSLQQQLSNFKKLEDLIKIWKDLVLLKQLLPVENKNFTNIKDLEKKVENIFNKIEIAEIIHIPGRLAIALLYENKALETSISPTLKSKCAKLLNTDRLLERWTIDYSYENCTQGPLLPIDIEFGYGNNKISKRFEINTSLERIEVKIGNFDFVIKGNNLTFYVSSMYKKKLILERLVIQYNNLHYTDTPLQQILDGAGYYDITFNLPNDFNNVKIDERVRGTLYFKSAATGQKGVFHFYNCEVKRK